ncbi:MAG: hypothetical protein AAFP02_23775, partial [Bacteroidota bacterium]
MATRLDSLYDRVETDSLQAPLAFFEELEKLYTHDGDINPINIKDDFEANRFLRKKINIVYGEYLLSQNVVKDTLAILRKQLNGHFASAIAMVESDCKYTREERAAVFNLLQAPCNVQDELIAFINEPSLKNLSIIKDKTDSESLKKRLMAKERDIYKTMRSIETQEQGSGNSFQLTTEAGTGMMPVSTAASPNVPPIILQQQGGGSLQSSIIDGTSKWIA